MSKIDPNRKFFELQSYHKVSEASLDKIHGFSAEEVPGEDEVYEQRT